MVKNRVEYEVSAKDKTNKGFKSARGGLKGLKDEAIASTKVFTAFAVSVAAVGLSKLVLDAAALEDQMNKTSARTGILVEDLSALKFAAQQNDVEFQTLTKGIKSMSEFMLLASEGAKIQAGAFKALNVEVVDSEGRLRNTAEVLLDVADAFQDMDDGVSRHDRDFSVKF